MVSLINDIVNGTGKFIHEILPEVSVYDKFTEQNLELPAVIIEVSNNYTRPRITGRYRMVQSLVALRCYANDSRELRDIVSTIILMLREIDLPDGPVLTHAIGNSYLSDTTATINFRVRVDMQIEERHDPLMESLTFQERIKQ